MRTFKKIVKGVEIGVGLAILTGAIYSEWLTWKKNKKRDWRN